jgi:hypothetical protein
MRARAGTRSYGTKAPSSTSSALAVEALTLAGAVTVAASAVKDIAAWHTEQCQGACCVLRTRCWLALGVPRSALHSMACAVPLQRGGRGASTAALRRVLVVGVHVWLSAAVELGVRIPGYNAHISPPPPPAAAPGAFGRNSLHARSLLSSGIPAPGAAGGKDTGACSAGVWNEAPNAALESGSALPSVRLAACSALLERWLCTRTLGLPIADDCSTAPVLAHAALCPVELRFH